MAKSRVVAWVTCTALALSNVVVVNAADVDESAKAQQTEEPVVDEAAPAFTDVQLVADLASKDTDKVDSVAAGDEQKTNFELCKGEGSDACWYAVGAVVIVGIAAAAYGQSN